MLSDATAAAILVIAGLGNAHFFENAGGSRCSKHS